MRWRPPPPPRGANSLSGDQPCPPPLWGRECQEKSPHRNCRLYTSRGVSRALGLKLEAHGHGRAQDIEPGNGRRPPLLISRDRPAMTSTGSVPPIHRREAKNGAPAHLATCCVSGRGACAAAIRARPFSNPAGVARRRWLLAIFGA
jgi:hypothetical protein